MPCVGKQHYIFHNWSQTHSCQPELYYEPSSVEDIRQILCKAKECKKKIKVVGSGMSPSDIACTDDYMISLKHFNKIIDIDTERHVITVESGITIKELNDHILPANGLAFSNLPSVSEPSIGGIIATAAHGSGGQFGSFSSHVLQLTIMIADGTILHCSEVENKKLFDAARCHLGLLGIVLNATIQCEPAFLLLQKQVATTLDVVLNNLENHINSSQHFKFVWFPHTEHVVTVTNDRNVKSASAYGKTYRFPWLWKVFFGYYILELCLWFSSFFPRLVPTINALFFKLCYSGTHEFVQKSDKLFNINCLFQQYVTEWAVPRQHTVIMLKMMRKWLNDNPSVKAHFPIEIRFVKKDNIFMSPSGFEDVTYIGIISFRPYGKFVPHEEWWNFFEDLAQRYGGKPHWAKAHGVKAADFQKMYIHFNQFMSMRQRMDPENLFVNNYWQRILEG